MNRFDPLPELLKHPTYERMVMMSSEAEADWEELAEKTKKSILSHLRETCEKMENKAAIEMLCLLIQDMNKKIDLLNKRYSQKFGE